MTPPTTEHDWFNQRLATALAGGLSPEEQKQFDSLAAQDPACANALADAKNAEAEILAVLSDLRPAGDLEQRLVGGLRRSASRSWLRIAAAAAIMAVGLGSLYMRVLPRMQLIETAVRAGQAQSQLASSDARAFTPWDSADQSVNFDRKREILQNTPVLDLPEHAAKSLADRYADVSINAPAAPGGDVRREMMAVDGQNRFDNGIQAGGGGFGGRAQTSNINLSPPAGSAIVSNGASTLGLAGNSGNFAQQSESSTPEASDTLNYHLPQNAAENKDEAGKATSDMGLIQPITGPVAAAAPPETTSGEVTQKQATKEYAQSTDAPAPAAMPAQPMIASRPEATPAPVTQQPSAPPATASPTSEQPAYLADRKIIRTGAMEFEVDSFDSAFMRLRVIVGECQGYIGSTDSERLPNGKMQGSITIRVPPLMLDVLVLKLRGLGDLKGQKITAEDITKEYTDLQSELRAAQAMEDRLLEIIKNGKGSVKDLLAAENELGTWREKVEHFTGEINYFNNLVSLSTLTVTLTEKDIGQAVVATETETVSAGLEADDVPAARDQVFKAVNDAKGRIIQAELRQQDQDQFVATITAAIPPDSAGAVIDRLHQLGKITRLESNRQQTLNGQTAPPGLRVERQDTVINLSIYNVAAYAAKITDNFSLGCDDVETSYQSILDFVKKLEGARITSSNLTRPRPDTASASVTFEVRQDTASAAEAFLKSLGAVLQFNVQENPDADNVTSSKRAFCVTIAPLASIPPQETDELTLLPKNGDLLTAYTSLVDFAGNPAHGTTIIDKGLEQQNGSYTSASIIMEVQRADLDAAHQAVDSAGDIVERKTSRQPDSSNCVDSKVLLKFSFVNVAALNQEQPRRTYTLEVETTATMTPADLAAQLISATNSAGGQVINHQDTTDSDGRTHSSLTLAIPLSQAEPIAQTLRQNGTIHQDNTTEDATAPGGQVARARMEITLDSPQSGVTQGNSLTATLEDGLATSFRGLLWSLELLTVGLCLLGPWALICWIIWRIFRKKRKEPGSV
jgi:Domain of unknown function (DUF4349)